MKKQNVLNLIKSHVEKNEISFRDEAINIARYFDNIGDYELAEYIMGLVAGSNLYMPQDSIFESKFLKSIELENLRGLSLPQEVSKDLKGVINAINHNIGINKFLFEGKAGSGKTEAAKHLTRLLNRKLLYVDFEDLIDAKLGQTNKNIVRLFYEISTIPNVNKFVVLFDEIDAIALDRINSNDVREMGRATSTILKELDRLSDLNKEVVIIATTNLYTNFDRALLRRFDATINFNRYNNEDLIEIASNYFSLFARTFKNISKDMRLFKKILRHVKKLPYPGELKNIVKTSLAFSDTEAEYDYLIRLYDKLIGGLEDRSEKSLYNEGFTLREIEKLTGKSKSTISRKLDMKAVHE